jgi:predicted CoA-binding protein
MDEAQILDIARTAKTVAVYGMQDESKSDRPAYSVPAALHAKGYRVYPVNPTIQTSLGLRALASLADLPVKPDILDVFRRTEFIPALADEIIALPEAQRPKTVWLQTGIAHAEAEAKLQAAGMQVVSNRCLAVYAARGGR